MSSAQPTSVRLGFGLITAQRYPFDDRDSATLVAEALELAEVADEMGLDSVWVSEHHFVDDGHLASPLPFCAAIAARTKRIAVGTGLLLAPLYDKRHLAEDAATVDLVSGGRLILGLGRGWRAEEFDGFGVPLRERTAHLEQAVTLLRQAWRGELVPRADEGEPGVAVRPLPAHVGGPPIWIGAMAEPSIRRAGRIGDGFMTTEVTPGEFARQVSWAVEESARRSGKWRDFAISLHLPTFVWDGPDAFELMMEHARYVEWKYDDIDGARARVGAPSAPPRLTEADRERLHDSVIWGTPDVVARRIVNYVEAADRGVHFIARLYLPGLSFDVQRRTLELFATEVAPRVQDLLSSR